jgi:hypothetical protein
MARAKGDATHAVRRAALGAVTPSALLPSKAEARATARAAASKAIGAAMSPGRFMRAPGRA